MVYYKFQINLDMLTLSATLSNLILYSICQNSFEMVSPCIFLQFRNIPCHIIIKLYNIFEKKYQLYVHNVVLTLHN